MATKAIQMDTTRIEMVMEQIRRRIAGRSLLPGSKLPSVRAHAKTSGVSVSTVVEAYNRLVAEGVVLSRPGSGFYVATQTAPLLLSEVGPKLDRAIDPFWVSRQSLEATDNTEKPGCGWLPPDWLPEAGLRRGLRALSRASGIALAEYGSPLGLPPLRQLITRRMAEKGIEAPPDQVILTESGTQAIDLLCRYLIDPGDTVLLDDPCYFNFQALLRAHRVQVVSVPYTPNGPDIEVFASVLAEHRPRLYITNSAVHNPTGATLSPVIAHRVLMLAEQHGLTIVEDDIFADFEHVPGPRLAAFDGLNRVIHIGSFSKTLSASARCGFIAAKKDWIDGIVDLKIATTFGGGRLNAELVLSVLSDGGHRKYLEGLRMRLARARHEVGAKLREIGIVPLLEPHAGMFLWCRVPGPRSSAQVARAALVDGVVLAPGNAFSPAQTAGDLMRFNVSQIGNSRVFETIQRSLSQSCSGDR
ncbi:PLP-dependent aminotransferase family protein [Aminobacter sp. NyZ550]|uniref:aminotransferase-like domain-containing protein n=1 Tax=Aminobacter sp. NyZ550 TaxID=2979870 RepID=UPI0021D58108|nr:PLP-dependent aminotransferase family protein [Aminobacter sp. NyZ550]WAX96572.1 PLP-dependent aminotransferase family protein [Aminobacter sp. NyZ550]